MIEAQTTDTNSDLTFEAKAKESGLQISSLKPLTTFAPKAQDLVVNMLSKKTRYFSHSRNRHGKTITGKPPPG
jgi:hypothetical protein